MARRRFFFSTLIALALGFAAPVCATAQDSNVQRLSLETYLDMESVSNPQISPDGATIVYTRGWIDKLNDRRRSSLWIMDQASTGVSDWFDPGQRIARPRLGFSGTQRGLASRHPRSVATPHHPAPGSDHTSRGHDPTSLWPGPSA